MKLCIIYYYKNLLNTPGANELGYARVHCTAWFNTEVGPSLLCSNFNIYIIRSGYFAGHRLRYKNLFCRSLISSCWTLGLGFGLGYRRMMDVRVRVRVWIRI